MANNIFQIQAFFDALSEDFLQLLSTPDPIELHMFEFNGFDMEPILDGMLVNAKENNKTKTELFKDLLDIVKIGLVGGDVRQDQMDIVARSVEMRTQRISQLATNFKIPLRKNGEEKMSDKIDVGTLTFTRSLACFPHFASVFIAKHPRYVRNGVKSSLQSEKLPDVMKHSGFAALIPNNTVNPMIKKVFVLAHTAYMIDFMRLVNPQGFNGIKEAYGSQTSSSSIVREKSMFTDDHRVHYLIALGLDTLQAFKSICEVASDLNKELSGDSLNLPMIEAECLGNNAVQFLASEEDEKKAREEARGIKKTFNI